MEWMFATVTCLVVLQGIDKGLASPVSNVVTQSGISNADKTTITELHNAYRRVIALNATNMMKMYWDDDLAAKAQKHAEKCPIEHDKLANRWTTSLPGVYIGQNMCVGKSSWSTCVQAWIAEKADFSYGNGAMLPYYAKIGHFTQLTNWHASRFGCGYAECSNTVDKTFYVCNYAYGQYYHDIHAPWNTGSSCAECQSKCDKSLCDCGGKICKNYGTIDLNSCTCSCLPQYSGDDCGTLDCSHQDHSSCARHPKDECTSGTNIAAFCPQFCGRCN